MLNSTEYKDAEILRLIGAEIASYEDRPQKKRFGKTWQDDMPEIQAWLESVGSSAETAVEQFRREGVVDLFVKHAAGVLDSKAYVNMTHLPVWEVVFDNAKRFRRWIDSVSEDIIRRKQEARRLKVHAGDWSWVYRAWSALYDEQRDVDDGISTAEFSRRALRRYG